MHQSIIQENIANLHQRIAEAARQSGRTSNDITLVGVSKTVDDERILCAYNAGLREFGENRVQELCGKMDRITRPCNWHLIGHLQTNKVKDVIGRVRLIQSLDRIKLADELQRRAAAAALVVDTLVQVNVADEDSKFGLSVYETLPFLQQMLTYDAIRIRGLMTIAPFVDNENEVRPVFAALRELFEQAKSEFDGAPNVSMEHLSMGMSGDLVAAIAEGSNMIRVGTAIFGIR